MSVCAIIYNKKTLQLTINRFRSMIIDWFSEDSSAQWVSDSWTDKKKKNTFLDVFTNNPLYTTGNLLI